MLTWNCDICGISTWVNPPTKPAYDFIEEEVKLNGKIEKVKKPVPRKAKMRRQNPFTGKVEELEIPDIEDLKPRTIIVQLSAGNEKIQKDFCKECFKKHVEKEVSKLWHSLAKIESK